MKKLILSLFFIILCLTNNSIISMAAEDQSAEEKSNVLEENFPQEMIHYILVGHTEDIYGYFVNVIKIVKTIKFVNKSFRRIAKALVADAKRRAQNHFSIQLSECDTNGLGERLKNVFKRAITDSKQAEKLNEDELSSEAAQLIIAGADHNNITVEYRGPSGHSIKISILQFIARTNLFIKLIPILVMYNVNIDAQDILGNTALYSAVTLGHVDAVRMICDCGGNVDIKNKDQNTVLHWVAEQLIEEEKPDLEKNNKCISIIHILLKHGDLTVQNEEGETILDILADYDGEDQKLKLLARTAELGIVNSESDEPDKLVEDFIMNFLDNLKK